MNHAVILAGGLGTRLRPLTDHVPKPLVAIAGRPFLEWQLEYLRGQGIDSVLLLLSYQAEKIIEYFRQKPVAGLRLDYSIESSPAGTGGAVKLALSKLPSDFFLLNGDSFTPLRLREMASFHQQMNCEFSMAVVPTQIHREALGNVKIAEQHLIDYKRDGGESAGYLWIDAGVYCCQSSAIETWPDGVFSVESTWPAAMSRGPVAARVLDHNFYDIGTLERLRNFEAKIHDYF